MATTSNETAGTGDIITNPPEQCADAAKAVFMQSKTLPESTPVVQGYDFNNGIDYHKLFETYLVSGFQATNFGLAVQEINKMIDSRKTPLPDDKLDEHEEDEFIKRKHNCTIFLGYTSNMVSCGVRDTIRFLVQHKMVRNIECQFF